MIVIQKRLLPAMIVAAISTPLLAADDLPQVPGTETAELPACQPVVCEPAEALVEEAQEAVEEAPKLWSGEVVASYVNLSGNTEETTTSGSIDLVRENAGWKYAAHLDGHGSETNGVHTAEKYFAYNRLQYSYSEKNYVFGHITYDKDRFGGFDYQASATVGAGRYLLADVETMEWDIEAGVGYRRSELDDNSYPDDYGSEDEGEGIVRLASLYKWQLSDTAEFSQLLGTEAGSDNTISKSETALTADIIGALAMKLYYKVKYTEEVPADTDHADTETGVGLSYSF